MGMCPQNCSSWLFIHRLTAPALCLITIHIRFPIPAGSKPVKYVSWLAESSGKSWETPNRLSLPIASPLLWIQIVPKAIGGLFQFSFFLSGFFVWIFWFYFCFFPPGPSCISTNSISKMEAWLSWKLSAPMVSSWLRPLAREGGRWVPRHQGSMKSDYI